MKVAVFSTKLYDREFLDAGGSTHALTYFDVRLSSATAPLAQGFDAVCVFVNDVLDADTLAILKAGGTRCVALRCAGFNQVDLKAAQALGITVVRVPAYSPHAVAEHTVGLMLMLNRRLHRAYNRVREGNFSLDGLLGFDMKGRSVGVVGCGRIGLTVARILQGFGCEVLANDVVSSDEGLAMGLRYVDLPTLFAGSDIVTLHCPLNPQTHHLIDAAAIACMRRGVMLINTGRGALVDTSALIAGLKSGQLGHVGLDVYEEEAELFFEDLSGAPLQDDVFARLLTFPNVVVTGHQAFFTRDALAQIAATTLSNLSEVEQGLPCAHALVV